MNYLEDERKRAIKIRNEVFRDPGSGIFRNEEREFVLKDASLNLWAGIRSDALAYFNKYNISWWMPEGEDEPTGHLLSSQIACLNHLYFLRQRKDVATEILKNVSADIEEALVVDKGYVEFEVIGNGNYLNERTHTRGANSTSIDAVMVGKLKSGSNLLVMIEWKYTESYAVENKYIPERAKVYDKLLRDASCPITIDDCSSLYFEPFYQLMRQTLLGWKMVQYSDYGCDDYIHLHIIPEKNRLLKDKITSPKLRSRGSNMCEAWKSVLKEPNRYIVLTPEKFVTLDNKDDKLLDTRSIRDYLKKRYWS